MPRIPQDAKRGFLIVLGALAALWVASKIQERIG